LGEEGQDAGGSPLLKSIRADSAIPLTVGDIMRTSTAAVAGAKDWIEEVAEAAGGCCEANWAGVADSASVAPTD